jgi:hypothetical protein
VRYGVSCAEYPYSVLRTEYGIRIHVEQDEDPRMRHKVTATDDVEK